MTGENAKEFVNHFGLWMARSHREFELYGLSDLIDHYDQITRGRDIRLPRKGRVARILSEAPNES